MDVDSPWRADSTIGAITHGSECAPCFAYRSHAFEALCLQDAGFASALSDGKQHWAVEGDSHWRSKFDALLKDWNVLKSDYTNARDDYADCKKELREADERIESLKEENSELKEKLLAAEEGRARYLALASKGKQRELPPDLSEPVAKRIRTLSLEDTLPSVDFPNLPPPMAAPTPGGKSLRPPPGTSAPYATAVRQTAASASNATAGPSRTPAVGQSTAVAGPSTLPGQSTAHTLPVVLLPLRAPIPRTISEAQLCMTRAHEGGPGRTPHMPSVMTMRRMVAIAQEARRTKLPLTDLQEFVVKNWRVPPGVEKSTDRVERQLGLPSNRPKRRGVRGAHPDEAPSVAGTVVSELPYTAGASGSGTNVPSAGLTALSSQAVAAPALTPSVAMDMVAEPTGAAVSTPVPQAQVEPTPEPMEQVQDTGPSSAVDLPVVVAEAAAAAAAAATTPPTQRKTLIGSLLDADGNLPDHFDNPTDENDANVMRRQVEAIARNPKAVMGFKAAGGPMPPDAFRRVECCKAILRNAPSKIALRRRFMTLAMALLLPQGAYITFLEKYHPGPIPARVHVQNCSKRTPNIGYVGFCLYEAGVTPLEASEWDDFVLAYCQDYLADPTIEADDEIRLSMQDRLQPPAHPQGYRVLECIGHGGRSPLTRSRLRLPVGDEPKVPRTKPRPGTPEYEAALQNPAATRNMFDNLSDWSSDD